MKITLSHAELSLPNNYGFQITDELVKQILTKALQDGNPDIIIEHCTFYVKDTNEIEIRSESKGKNKIKYDSCKFTAEPKEVEIEKYPDYPKPNLEDIKLKVNNKTITLKFSNYFDSQSVVFTYKEYKFYLHMPTRNISLSQHGTWISGTFADWDTVAFVLEYEEKVGVVDDLVADTYKKFFPDPNKSGGTRVLTKEMLLETSKDLKA